MFCIALISPKDFFHKKALELAKQLRRPKRILLHFICSNGGTRHNKSIDNRSAFSTGRFHCLDEIRDSRLIR